MKRYLLLLLLTILISHTDKAYCQEEFFGNNNGLSLAYLQGFNINAKAAGLSMFFKKGIILGFGFENAYNTTAPSASVLYYPNWGVDSILLKTAIGPSFTNFQDQFIVSFNTGLVRCFYNESRFPFSINASFSPQISFIKNPPSNGYFPGELEKFNKELSLVIGGGITQAFFKNNYAYPFIGLSVAHDISSKINFFSAVVGVNIIWY
jgi:hypothetical protein